jgi:uncharacterized membrane protein YjjB (DUF3815 family)
MKAGQVLVIIAAIGMLLPGGCFLVVSLGVFSDPHSIGLGLLVLAIAAGFLALSVYLFRLAIRWNRPPASASPPSTKPQDGPGT